MMLQMQQKHITDIEVQVMFKELVIRICFWSVQICGDKC